MSRFVTHIKRLKNASEPTGKFIASARLLGEKLGPLLYQLPPNLHRDDAVLEDYLSGLPVGLEHVFEFRHESWLDEGVFDILRRHGAGFCVFDMPSLSCPLEATAGFAYVRFHGGAALYSSCYTDEALAGWARKLERLAARLGKVYIYFNNDVSAFAVRNALTLGEYLGVRRMD